MKDPKGHGSEKRGLHSAGIENLPVKNAVGNIVPARLHARPVAPQPGVWYHGSPTGVPGATGQIHVGTLAQARIALEARIGVPADGQGWNGDREYGKTLIAGQDTLDRLQATGTYVNKYPQSGYNSGSANESIPKHDYYPTDRTYRATMGRDQTPVPFEAKPAVRAYQIVGTMTNSPNAAYSDTKANALANAQQTRGSGKNGFYYSNSGEGEGVSAVVPSRAHLRET